MLNGCRSPECYAVVDLDPLVDQHTSVDQDTSASKDEEDCQDCDFAGKHHA